MLLSVDNTLDKLPQTLWSYTSSNASSGGTVIPIKNTNSFAANYAVQIGKTGEEQSEIVIIDSPTGTILPITSSGTLRFDHPLDTPVYQIHYNKIIFKRSTSGTAGTATAIATVSITPDSMYTEYNDTSGAASYAYKTQYYNSVSGDLSSESDWFTPAGMSFYSLGKLRDRAKNTFYNAGFLPSDTVIDDWVNEWVEEMNRAAVKVNKGYAIGTANYAFGTAGYGTITEGGFRKATKIEVTFDGITYRPSSEIPMSEYSDNDFFSGMYPKHSWEGDTVFRILPFGSLGTARFSFSKLNDQLVNETDELPVPFRGYTNGCIEYCQYRGLGKDEKPTDNQHYNNFLRIKNDFVSEMTPRDFTGPKYIELTDGLSGMNEDTLAGSDWFI